MSDLNPEDPDRNRTRADIRLIQIVAIGTVTHVLAAVVTLGNERVFAVLGLAWLIFGISVFLCQALARLFNWLVALVAVGFSVCAFCINGTMIYAG